MVLKDVRAQGTLISVHFPTKPSKWRQFYARGSKSNNSHEIAILIFFRLVGNLTPILSVHANAKQFRLQKKNGTF